MRLSKVKSIYSEFTIASRKWMWLNIYRPPNPNNMNTLFDEMTTSLSEVVMKYKNTIKLGGFNFFNLRNLIYSETYLMKND